MGLATAKRFVLEGADHIFITGRRKDALESAVAEIGEKATGIPGDVATLFPGTRHAPVKSVDILSCGLPLKLVCARNSAVQLT
jgi:NADP-dependent 3-hydroxy acid dehydrogenase YdfG